MYLFNRYAVSVLVNVNFEENVSQIQVQYFLIYNSFQSFAALWHIDILIHML